MNPILQLILVMAVLLILLLIWLCSIFIVFIKIWCFITDNSFIKYLIEDKKVGSKSRNFYLWIFDITEKDLENTLY